MNTVFYNEDDEEDDDDENGGDDDDDDEENQDDVHDEKDEKDEEDLSDPAEVEDEEKEEDNDDQFQNANDPELIQFDLYLKRQKQVCAWYPFHKTDQLISIDQTTGEFMPLHNDPAYPHRVCGRCYAYWVHYCAHYQVPNPPNKYWNNLPTEEIRKKSNYWEVKDL